MKAAAAIRRGAARVAAGAKPLIPVPKVYVPALAGLVAMGATWIATGEFSRDELALVFASAGYATIGWATPER